MHFYTYYFFTVLYNVKRKAELSSYYIFSAINIFLSEAESHDIRADVLRRFLRPLIVAVDIRPACHGEEFMEGQRKVFHRLEIIKMVIVDIKKYGDIGRELQKRIHKLAGFADHRFRAARYAV